MAIKIFSSDMLSLSDMDIEKVREKITFRWVILTVDIIFFIVALGLVIWYGSGSGYLPGYPNLNQTVAFRDMDQMTEYPFKPWTAGITCYTLLLLFLILRHVKPLPSIIPALSSLACSFISILIFVIWGSELGPRHDIYPLITFTWNVILTSVYTSAWVFKNVVIEWRTRCCYVTWPQVNVTYCLSLIIYGNDAIIKFLLLLRFIFFTVQMEWSLVLISEDEIACMRQISPSQGINTKKKLISSPVPDLMGWRPIDPFIIIIINTTPFSIYKGSLFLFSNQIMISLWSE